MSSNFNAVARFRSDVIQSPRGSFESLMTQGQSISTSCSPLQYSSPPSFPAEKLDGSDGRPPVHRRRLMWLSIIIVVACTMFNLALWRRMGRANQTVDTDNLPHIHSYIGLEDLQQKLNESYEDTLSVVNYPHILTQISSADPNKVWPDDSAGHFNPTTGTLSPDARRFSVERGVSSLAQFRIVDFGMERCHLELDLRHFLIENANWAWPSPQLDVWKLDVPLDRFLQVRALSWNTRPERSQKLVSWSLKSDTVFSSGDLDCQWGTFPAFEFQCEAVGCVVSFWSNPSEAFPGTYSVIQLSILINVSLSSDQTYTAIIPSSIICRAIVSNPCAFLV
jgi:hypothetical protein